MRFSQIAVGAAVAIASVGSFAAAGDVVFTSDPFGSSVAKNAGVSSDFSFSDLAVKAGQKYVWEVGVQTTGGMSLKGVTFNGQALGDITTPKYFHGSSTFFGPDMVVHVSGASTSAGSFSGTLTVTAVPEPETYALMLAGLAAVGYVARRRRSA